MKRFCSDCKHCSKSTSSLGYDLYKCSHIDALNIITKKPTDCDDNRAKSGTCGINGICFESKVDAVPESQLIEKINRLKRDGILSNRVVKKYGL